MAKHLTVAFPLAEQSSIMEKEQIRYSVVVKQTGTMEMVLL